MTPTYFLQISWWRWQFWWGKRLGNSGGDLGAGIATDPNTGNIVLTGA
jgi:hypothetical protein